MKTNNSNLTLFVWDITLSNFRNYDCVKIDSNKKSVILTGKNGSGKTNLLEAISLLTSGRGLRGGKTEDFLNNKIAFQNSKNQTKKTLGDFESNNGGKPASNPSFAPPHWGVFANVKSFMGEVTIGTGTNPQNTNQRAVKVNQNKTTQSNLNNYLSAVWLTPQMDRIFNDSASKRRFLDRLILGFDKKHSARITGYEKAMRLRSQLLKDGVNDKTWLKSLELEMTKKSIAIAAARNLLVDNLNREIENGHLSFPAAKIELDGTVENWMTIYSALETENLTANALEQSRDLDAIGGGANIGIHKTNVAVFHLNKQINAKLCSTGEQKALLIAIVLGNLKLQKAETGYMPLLLLDEIPAHLDKQKLEDLFSAIEILAPQVWYSGTDFSDFLPIAKKCSTFEINEGNILQKN